MYSNYCNFCCDYKPFRTLITIAHPNEIGAGSIRKTHCIGVCADCRPNVTAQQIYEKINQLSEAEYNARLRKEKRREVEYEQACQITNLLDLSLDKCLYDYLAKGDKLCNHCPLNNQDIYNAALITMQYKLGKDKNVYGN